MLWSDDRYGWTWAFSRDTNLRATILTNSIPLHARMSTQTKADFWLSRKILLGNKLVKTKLLKIFCLGYRPPLLQYLSTLLLFFIPSSINCTLVSIIVPHEVVGSWYLDFSTHRLRICSAWRFPLLIHLRKKTWKLSKGNALRVSIPHWKFSESCHTWETWWLTNRQGISLSVSSTEYLSKMFWPLKFFF